MNSKSSGGRLEAFFTGKGFYIVLLLCAAIIGGSAWMMAAGEREMAEEISVMNRDSLEKQTVKTVILPPVQEDIQPAMAPETQVTRPAGEVPEEPEESVETLSETKEAPAVSVGDWVEPGDVIGAVGATALDEIGQGTHLHFAVTVDGVNVNPLDYLPG